jgi:hypothetical protein
MDWYDDEDDERDLSAGLDEADWIAAGIAALERYLARHAAFEAWCYDHFRRYGRRPGDLTET